MAKSSKLENLGCDIKVNGVFMYEKDIKKDLLHLCYKIKVNGVVRNERDLERVPPGCYPVQSVKAEKIYSGSLSNFINECNNNNYLENLLIKKYIKIWNMCKSDKKILEVVSIDKIYIQTYKFF